MLSARLAETARRNSWDSCGFSPPLMVLNVYAVPAPKRSRVVSATAPLKPQRLIDGS